MTLPPSSPDLRWFQANGSHTQAAADLAPPRWNTAGFAKFDPSESVSWSKNSKPLSKPLCGRNMLRMRIPSNSLNEMNFKVNGVDFIFQGSNHDN
jgi:hypothetical protein